VKKSQRKIVDVVLGDDGWRNFVGEFGQATLTLMAQRDAAVAACFAGEPDELAQILAAEPSIVETLDIANPRAVSLLHAATRGGDIRCVRVVLKTLQRVTTWRQLWVTNYAMRHHPLLPSCLLRKLCEASMGPALKLFVNIKVRVICAPCHSPPVVARRAHFRLSAMPTTDLILHTAVCCGSKRPK